MKRTIFTTLITLALTCALFCACDDEQPAPLTEWCPTDPTVEWCPSGEGICAEPYQCIGYCVRHHPALCANMR